jgi:hypothetical protein
VVVTRGRRPATLRNPGLMDETPFRVFNSKTGARYPFYRVDISSLGGSFFFSKWNQEHDNDETVQPDESAAEYFIRVIRGSFFRKCVKLKMGQTRVFRILVDVAGMIHAAFFFLRVRRPRRSSLLPCPPVFQPFKAGWGREDFCKTPAGDVRES